MRRIVLGLLALVPLLPNAALADELPLKETFARTARATGHVYEAGRQVLLEDTSPSMEILLRTEVTSTDLRRSLLAQALRLRRDDVERSSALLDALAARRTTAARPDSGADQAIVRFVRANSNGVPIETREVTFFAYNAPLLADALYAAGGSVPVWTIINAARIAGTLRDARLVDAVVHAIGHATYHKAQEKLADALARFGPLAAPDLRAVLLRPARKDHQANYRADLRRRKAAAALAAAGDVEAAPILAKLLPDARAEDMVTAYGTALATLAPTKAAPLLRQHLERIARARRGDARGSHSSQHASYAAVRRILLQMGPEARPALVTTPKDAFGSRLLCAGIDWELAHAAKAEAFYKQLGTTARRGWWNQDMTAGATRELGRDRLWRGHDAQRDAVPPQQVPVAILREFAWVEQRVSALAQLARSTDATDRAVAVQTLLGPRRRQPPREVLLALAEQPGPETLTVAKALIAAPRIQHLDGVVEALLLRGDADGAEALDALVARADSLQAGYAREALQKVAPLAKQVAAVLRGTVEVSALLEGQDETARLAAARVLARRGDARGNEVLAQAILAAPQGSYAALRNDLVRSGAAPKRGAADDVPRHVLAAAVALRIAKPALAPTVEGQLSRAYPSNGSIKGPQLHDFVHAGTTLAQDLPKESRPLLEEAILFGDISPRVAVFALASFADEASIPVIVRAAPRLGSYAAEALKRFGPAGVAAAAKIPPPDPMRAAYGARARRHVVATKALEATAEGLTKLLEGLAEAKPAGGRAAVDAWRERMQRYLRMASERDDAELLEPTLRLLASHGGERGIRVAAFLVLRRHKDPRIAPLCVHWLSRHDSDDRVIRRALAAQLDTQAPAYLITAAAQSADAVRQRALLHHAVAFALAGHGSKTSRDAVAAALRPLLKNANKVVRGLAAWDLLDLHSKRPAPERAGIDREAVLAYVAAERAPEHIVALGVAEQHLEGAAEALLASYRLEPNRSVLYSLAALGVQAAVPDVIAAFEKELGERQGDGKVRPYGYPTLRALAKLGPQGQARVLAVLGSDAPLDVRIAAANACAETGLAAGFDGALTLLKLLMQRSARSNSEVRWLHAMAGALGRMDPKRAHDVLTKLVVATEDPGASKVLTAARAHLQQRHPELAK